MKNKITLIGRGLIGETIEAWLSPQYNLSVLDINTGFDANDVDKIRRSLQGQDMVIAATPFSVNRNIAQVAVELDVDYFDLTEDVETTAWIAGLSATSKIIPQCGLAPGIINMCTQNLMKDFETVNEVKLRVGALPRYTSNQLGYYLTWSTEGLINEYCNPVQVIDEGGIKEVAALGGLERLIFEGIEFEAFSTSGGVGQMCQTYQGKVQKLDYKSIRYPGHCEQMRLLLKELGLSGDRTKAHALFNDSLPRTTQDMVLIYAQVLGVRQGRLEEKVYHKKIFGDQYFSAIQKATASGLCGVIELCVTEKLKGHGFIKQESIGWDDFLNTCYGSLFID